MKPVLPRFARRFIAWMATGRDREIIEGDLEEALSATTKGTFRYYHLMIKEMFGLVRLSLLKRKQQRKPSGLYLNLTKVIFRNLRRKWGYSLINMLGLGVSLTVFGLMLAYVTHEFSYDRFHQDHQRTFRVTYQENAEEPVEGHWARVPLDWVNLMPEYFPQVEAFVRFQSFRFRDIRVGEQAYREQFAFAVDADVFDVFDVQFKAGDPESALRQPNSAVLTESIARKYFGDENPMGQTIRSLDSGGQEINYQVTGIIRDFPANSHLSINLLTSINSDDDRRGWAYIYIKLQEVSDREILSAQMGEFIVAHSPDPETTAMFNLQPIANIHLKSDLVREIMPNNRLSYILIFLVASIFLLVVASINFANLNTVQSLGRAREVGVRKFLGGSRSHLSRYFYLEAQVMFSGTLLMAVAGYGLLLPYLQQFLGLNLKPNYPIIGITGLLLTLGLPWITSLYPTQWLSRLETMKALKQQIAAGKNATGKRLLVGLQFALAMMLISSMLITQRQFSFLQQKHLGFQGEQVLAIRHMPDQAKQEIDFLRETLTRLPEIQDVSAVMELPGNAVRDGIALLKPGQEPDEGTNVDIQIVEPNFPELMSMTFAAGGPIPYATTYESMPEGSDVTDIIQTISSRKRHYVLNETAASLLGWDDPAEAIGQLISGNNFFYQLAEGPIVGVVKDYHQESLRAAIDPVVMVYEPIWLGHLLIRANLRDLMQSVNQVEEVWKAHYPGYPMDLTFLDQELNKLYMQEKKQLQLLQVFSMIAMLIAVLGLVGLMGYALKIRQKELTIRKVLGANLSSLVQLLAREYLLSLLIGITVAIPVVWWGMKQWLDYYAYHTNIGASSFVISVTVLFLLIMVPLVWLVLRSDRNPAEVLKDD